MSNMLFSTFHMECLGVVAHLGQARGPAPTETRVLPFITPYFPGLLRDSLRLSARNDGCRCFLAFETYFIVGE
jgi:hypothetical protein